jgi:hypothetical protein
VAKKIPNVYEAPAEELPDPSFGSSTRGEGKTPRIRHTRPEVAKHCAKMILSCNMDYESAVSKMWETEFPDATETQIVAKARELEKSPHVQREINSLAEKIGFGEKALEKLIGILWKDVLGGNDKRYPTAARLLAEITGAAKAKQKGETIPVLKIAGIEEGLKNMLGDLPTPSTIEEDEEDPE